MGLLTEERGVRFRFAGKAGHGPLDCRPNSKLVDCLRENFMIVATWRTLSACCVGLSSPTFPNL